jgi:hypothetical protein
MKFNKWTLGLAAVGAVSLVSAAKADEKMNSVQTAVSSTTISGYVSTSVHWNPGSGNASMPRYAFNTSSKADGFNLDVVNLTVAKPLDEAEWASGYMFESIFGPDANFFGTTPLGGALGTDYAIKQAYVTVRTPIFGTGIDWKLGVFDSIIGYESFHAGNNPNYTRSYGYTIEPTTHTGLLGTYRVCDEVKVSFGIANTTGPIIGGSSIGGSTAAGLGASVVTGRADGWEGESYKTYMGSVELTAPEEWSFLAGSTLYAGGIVGWGGGNLVTGDQQNYYVGATFATPLEGLRVGVSYDYVCNNGETFDNAGATIAASWANAASLYASFQATEKMSIHGRVEYAWCDDGTGSFANAYGAAKVLAVTGTLQYDLWENVISRLEVRWDTAVDDTRPFGGSLTGVGLGGINASTGGGGGEKNAVLVAANLIYKF